MSLNLTGQNIKDTYKRIIQYDSKTGNFHDGSGSLVNSAITNLTSGQRQSQDSVINDVSSSVNELQEFSASLDSNFATDSELSSLSSSVYTTVNDLVSDVNENEEELSNQDDRITSLTSATSSYVTFPYVGSAIITGSLVATGDSSRTRFLASTLSDLPSATDNHGMFAHVHSTGLGYYAHAGNWVPLATSESVANIDVTIPSTYFNSSLLETQTISKNFNYTSSLNVVEITSSVEGAIIDYRLTNLDSGSRVGTFMYAHDGTTLSYNDTTIPGAGVGSNPTLSATLTGSIVSLDIENAAGFNFSGFAKKFSKLDSAVPVADPNIPYLLDAYFSQNVVGGYSIRQLSQLYTGPAMRIRQSGSNTETDIGFDINGNLDTAAIISHCGSNIGYVTVWYDQSGNNNNIYQDTAGSQPLIYNGSSIYTLNNKPYIFAAGKAFISDMATLTSPYSYAGVLQATNIYARFGSTNNIYVHNSGFSLGGTRVTPVENWVGYQSAFFATIDGSSSVGKAGRNGSTPPSVTMNSSVNFPLDVLFARYNSTSTSNRYNVQEFLLWDSSESNNLEGIMNNINTHYDIYDTGFLANYPGAAVAYSVRQLITSVTSSMNIRRASDNIEQTIGFTSEGDLDTESIKTFCTGSECYVTTWYDQSGNGNNAIQTSQNTQPLIYSASAFIKNLDNRPALRFNEYVNNISSNLSHPQINTTNDSFTQIIVVDKASGGGRIQWAPGSSLTYRIEDSGIGFFIGNGDYDSPTFTTNPRGFFGNGTTISTMVRQGGTSSKAYVDGELEAEWNSLTPGSTHGFNNIAASYNTPSPNAFFDMSEYIIYDTDYSNTISNLQEDINEYYEIYNTNEVHSNGFLNTYSDAVLAFSVRKLGDTTLCMRIRRDSDNKEKNIGFDSNGLLDTSSISNFCGNANGFVSTWFNQVQKGNDAINLVGTSQPKIYNGASVLTENGYPIVNFDGDKHLRTTKKWNPSGITAARSAFVVGGVVSGGTGFVLVTQTNRYGWAGQGKDGSTSIEVNRPSNYPAISQHINGTTYSSPTQDQFFDAVGSLALYTGIINRSNDSSQTYSLGYPFSSTLNQDVDSVQIQEFITFESNQTSNRTAIETNINSYFNIY